MGVIAPRNALRWQRRADAEQNKIMSIAPFEDCEEPDHDDSVKCCPDCERPNQFGELCEACRLDRALEGDGNQ